MSLLKYSKMSSLCSKMLSTHLCTASGINIMALCDKHQQGSKEPEPLGSSVVNSCCTTEFDQ